MGFELLRERILLDGTELGLVVEESSFGFFTLFYNILILPVLGLFYLLNSFFRGFCFVVYNLFKIIHLLFKIIENFTNFAKYFLYFNYTIVSYGLELIHKIASNVNYFSRATYKGINGLLFAFICMIYNLPATLFQISKLMINSLHEFAYNGVMTFHDFSTCVINTLCLQASNLNTSLSAMTSVLISGLIHTANTLGEVIIAAFETTVTKVTGIIDCIFAPLHAVYLLLLQVFSIIVEIPNIVTSLMASLFELLKMAVNAANRLGGSFVDFIIMPFSLKNIAAIFQSLYLLLYASFSLLLSLVYVIVDATHQVIQWICTAAISIGKNLFSVFIQGHLWLAVVIILMTVIMYRQGFSGLKKLPELFRQLFSRGYVRRPNVIEHEFVIEEEPDVFVREERPIVPVEHDEEEPDANVRKDIVTDEQHICIACQENPRDILILPCRHLCLCHNCAEMLPGHQFGRRACPLCRKPIDNTMKVFM